MPSSSPDIHPGVAPASSLHLLLPDTREAVDICRLEVSRYLAEAGLSQQAMFRVEVVQEECLMNIIWHAFENDAEHSIDVHVQVEDGSISFRFEDSGRPFDPTLAANPQLPTSLRDAAPGGLGLLLVRQFASSVVYRRVEGRNLLTVTLPLN